MGIGSSQSKENKSSKHNHHHGAGPSKGSAASSVSSNRSSVRTSSLAPTSSQSLFSNEIGMSNILTKSKSKTKHEP